MNILSNGAAQKQQSKLEPEDTKKGSGNGRRESIDVMALLAGLSQERAIEAAADRPATPPNESNPDDPFADLAKQLHATIPPPLKKQASALQRPADALAQRQSLAEFLFKCYDSDGGGMISEDEFFTALMASFYLHRPTAEGRHDALAAEREAEREARSSRASRRAVRASRARISTAATGLDEGEGGMQDGPWGGGEPSPRPEDAYAEQDGGSGEESEGAESEDGGAEGGEGGEDGGYARPKTLEEIATEYCAAKFNRPQPFNDLDADTVAIFRDVVKRTFALIDGNGSGAISCREAVGYITLNPHIFDVGAVFGRAMLSGGESDIKQLVTLKQAELAKTAVIPPAERERRRQALYESLYRGEHVQRDASGVPLSPAPRTGTGVGGPQRVTPLKLPQHSGAMPRNLLSASSTRKGTASVLSSIDSVKLPAAAARGGAGKGNMQSYLRAVC
jgi:hypothetical protein